MSGGRANANQHPHLFNPSGPAAGSPLASDANVQEALVRRTQIALHFGYFHDASIFMYQLVLTCTTRGELTDEQRTLFALAQHHYIVALLAQRAALEAHSHTSSSDNNDHRQAEARDYMFDIEAKLRAAVDLVLDVIGDLILPNAYSDAARAWCWTMLGHYYRYSAQISITAVATRQEHKLRALSAYEMALEVVLAQPRYAPLIARRDETKIALQEFIAELVRL
ncbi:14-3-3 domain-containing protein [Mycena amicta]|nr:14-3-3 domain-containing protein [Mycena amicta]